MFFSQHHPSSFKPHLALMMLCLVAVIVLSFFLIIGWKWHFGEVANRLGLARISQLAENKFAEKATARAEKFKASAMPVIPETPSPSLTASDATATDALSLGEMAAQPDDNTFPNPVPLNETISPQVLSDATDVQQKFWQATTWKDKLPFVHDAARVAPQMRNYYETQQNLDPVADNVARQAHFRLNNAEVLLFSYSSPRPGGSVDLAMLAQPDGKFLIDWESYVGAGDFGWPDLKKQRPTKPTLLRVFVQRDDYFNYEFSDATKFHSLHLTSPDGLYFIYGFCEKNTPVSQNLTTLLDAARGRIPLTLRVTYPAQSQSDHCVKIVGIVANRWLLVK